MSEHEGGIKPWVRDLDKKVDTILEMMHKMEVHHSYSVDRHDAQCEKLGNHDGRIKSLEEEIAAHKGELSMLRWIMTAIGAIGVVAVPIIMLIK